MVKQEVDSFSSQRGNYGGTLGPVQTIHPFELNQSQAYREVIREAIALQKQSAQPFRVSGTSQRNAYSVVCMHGR